MRNTPCLDLHIKATRTKKSIGFVALTMYHAAATANRRLGVAMKMMSWYQICLNAMVAPTTETRHWTRCTFRLGRPGEIVYLST